MKYEGGSLIFHYKKWYKDIALIVHSTFFVVAIIIFFK